jgi:hypothetical protein
MRTILEIVRAELLQRAILVVFAAVFLAGIAIALKSSGFETTLPFLNWLLQ